MAQFVFAPDSLFILPDRGQVVDLNGVAAVLLAPLSALLLSPVWVQLAL